METHREKAGNYLPMLFDDPALPQPIRAKLFQRSDDKSSWSRHWSRPKQRDELGLGRQQNKGVLQALPALQVATGVGFKHQRDEIVRRLEQFHMNAALLGSADIPCMLC